MENKITHHTLFNKKIFITLIISVLFSVPGQLSAQSYLNAGVRNTNCTTARQEANLWFFGQNAGIDFRSGDPAAVGNNDILNSLQGCAIISDSTGNMLMLTNGVQVFNREQQVMPNGAGLHGDIGVTMPAIIIPKPGDEPVYFIFTVDRPKIYPGDTTAWGLQFSEVNMELDNGLGDVTGRKNVHLLAEVSEKVTAVRHSNGRDVWVVAHLFNSNEFCSFLVTESGIDTNFVSSKTGTVHEGPISTNNSVGVMKISPDGTRLALAIHGKKMYEIFNFNASTGQVSNPIPSPSAYSGAYGVEFSPDTKYLYTTTAFVGGLPDSVSRLYQFDISQGAGVFDSPVEIAINESAEYFCALQLATDGKIYVARSPQGFDKVGVIYNPKRPGLACNFNILNGSASSFDLAGKRSRYGMPNFIQSYFDVPHFDLENICFSDTTIFWLTNRANIESVTWNFGDPESSENISTEFEPSHTFTLPGEYMVTVTEVYGGISYEYQESVVVADLPYPVLGDTVYLYPGSSIVLDAGDGFTTYEWSTGETSSAIQISEPGSYWVYVQNDRCCFNGDSVEVVLFDIYVPNAFRPGGYNNRFRAVASSGQAIENFHMLIYNRWGQLFFESKDITEGWDGTFEGSPAPGDVYVWMIQWDILKDTGTERATYKGNVLLLR